MFDRRWFFTALCTTIAAPFVVKLLPKAKSVVWFSETAKPATFPMIYASPEKVHNIVTLLDWDVRVCEDCGWARNGIDDLEEVHHWPKECSGFYRRLREEARTYVNPRCHARRRADERDLPDGFIHTIIRA